MRKLIKLIFFGTVALTLWTLVVFVLDDDVREEEAGNHVFDDSAACVHQFLSSYSKYCHARLRPRPENVPARWRRRLKVDEKALCECVPRKLLGSLTYFADETRSKESVDRTMRTDDKNMVGGRWFPNRCVARHRVAVIVPYRNRAEHLSRLIYALHPFLQRQQLDYTIFVVEQITPSVFNRASLLNVGFLEAKAIGYFDCYIFHDVDMVPKDDRNFYTCFRTPRHLGQFRYSNKSMYSTYFGGAVAINPVQFELVNGFANEFFGWGGEDDDFRLRIIAKKLILAPHFPKCVAEYATAIHERDRGNPKARNRVKGRKFRPRRYKRKGLSTTNYQVVRIDAHLLYTKIYVKLRQRTDR